MASSLVFIYLCASSPLPRGYDVFSGAAPGAPPGDHKRVLQVKITWMCARRSPMVYGAMANSIVCVRFSVLCEQFWKRRYCFEKRVLTIEKYCMPVYKVINALITRSQYLRLD